LQHSSPACPEHPANAQAAAAPLRPAAPPEKKDGPLPGKGPEKTEKHTQRNESKKERRTDKELAADEDNIDALLAKFAMEERAKRAVEVEQDCAPPSARANASFSPCVAPVGGRQLARPGGGEGGRGGGRGGDRGGGDRGGRAPGRPCWPQPRRPLRPASRPAAALSCTQRLQRRCARHLTLPLPLTRTPPPPAPPPES
jgi:hypothetical protein